MLVGACEGSHKEIFELALRKGAGNLGQALLTACRKGDRKMFDLVVEKCAGNIPWNYALCGACEGGLLELARELVSQGASDFELALKASCKGGSKQVVLQCLKWLQSSQPEAKDDEKLLERKKRELEIFSECVSILSKSENPTVDIANILIERGAVVSPKNGRNPILYACKNFCADLNYLKCLVETAILEGEEGLYKNFFVHAACSGVQKEKVGFLVERGFKVFKRDETDRTALDHLCFAENAETSLAEFLLRKKHKREDLDSALRSVSSNARPNLEIAEMLLKRGADPNSRNHLGESPLHCACELEKKSLPLLRLLIDSGADVNATEFELGRFHSFFLGYNLSQFLVFVELLSTLLVFMVLLHFLSSLLLITIFFKKAIQQLMC